jgi:hypothetical protein
MYSKQLGILIFLTLSFVLNAQKSLQYESFMAGKNIIFSISFDGNSSINGHYIDFQSRKKYNISGKYIMPGAYFELSCNDSTASFRYLRLREDINNSNNLKGIFYGYDNYIGNTVLNFRNNALFQEENNDFKSINELYPLLLKDFAYNTAETNIPYLIDVETGYYFLNPKSSFGRYRGNPPAERESLKIGSLLNSFREQQQNIGHFFYENILHFQVLGYLPDHSILVISEELSGKINMVGDSSITHKYRLAVYQHNLEYWSNVTQKIMPNKVVSALKEKFSSAEYELGAKSLDLVFDRKCKIDPALPRTNIYIPNEFQKEGYKTLIWSWTMESQLILE